MSEAVVHGYPHGGMFLGRGVKTNNIVTRDGVVKEAVEAAALSAQGRDRRPSEHGRSRRSP